MKEATFLRDLRGWRGHARLYRVSPPMQYRDLDGTLTTTDHVVVSAAVVPFSGPETYIFPADSQGNVPVFDDLPGSFRGALDHDLALSDAGYTVV